MAGRIEEAVSRAGHPHHIVDKGRRPGVIGVLLLREDAAAAVMLAGEALLGIAHRQAEPPIFADPLPQSFGALVVERQFGVGNHHRRAKGAPFPECYLYRRLAREGLIGSPREGWDVHVAADARSRRRRPRRAGRLAAGNREREGKHQPNWEKLSIQQGLGPPPMQKRRPMAAARPYSGGETEKRGRVSTTSFRRGAPPRGPP